MFKFIAGYIWTQIQTTIHKARVLHNIVLIISNKNLTNKWKFYKRGLKHDISKYRWSEASYFAKIIFDLKHSTYGSDEYRKMLKSIRPAILSHYKKNSHHPEHYKNGFSDMSELDKLELIADWEAAGHRHKDGDILKSIEINQKRFGYSDEDKNYFITIAKILI